MESIWIKLLEYGEQVGINGTTFEELLNWAEKSGLMCDKNKEDYYQNKSFLKLLFDNIYQKDEDSGNEKWVLKPDYYFYLFADRQLNYSIRSSERAHLISTLAIIISILTFFVTAVTSTININRKLEVKSITDPVKIDESQLKSLIQLTKKIEP